MAWHPRHALSLGRFLPALLVLAGCSGFFDPAPDDPVSLRAAAGYRALPGESQDLLAIARDHFAEDGEVEDVAYALLAACKAGTLAPHLGEAWFMALRTCNWLVDFGRTPYCFDPRKNRAREVSCVEMGEKAVGRDEDNALYNYHLALALGLKIRDASLAGASVNINPLIRTLKRVIELDEGMDDGGALRVLGALYLKAPPWPTGPGDEEKAMELLAKAACDYPDHPLNHLFYAEALLELEELEQALVEVERARALLDPERFHWRTQQWKGMVDQLEGRIRKAIKEEDDDD